MKHFDKETIEKMDKVPRLNLINSISGIKPANLIGTKDEEGGLNVAVFSSVVHLGSNPALLGFILRPLTGVKRNTYDNILKTEAYTVNHIHENFVQNAHFTSAKFDPDISEFEKCNLTPTYKNGCHAPFVAESKIQLGMRYHSSVPIEVNGTIMVVGEVECIYVDDKVIEDNNHFNLSNSNNVGISGLNTYYKLTKINQFPYARPHELPEFKNSTI